MSKQPIPAYRICGLAQSPDTCNEFIADYFAHYLEAHKHLKFPHKHFFFHLVYFTKGCGSHSIDFVNFEVKPGDIYFMIPGQVHEWNFEGETDGFIINFLDEYLHPLVANPRFLDQFVFFSGVASEQVITIREEDREQLTRIFETIIQEDRSAEALNHDMVRAALIQLFILVSRSAMNDKKQTNSPNSTLLRNFQRLIDEHFKEKKLTKDYAQLLFVTPNHLNAVSKEFTGRSAGELIRDRIILEAKRLLVNGDMTVAEIALELEFTDNSYFSKFFKNRVGIAPEVFRKQIAIR